MEWQNEPVSPPRATADAGNFDSRRSRSLNHCCAVCARICIPNLHQSSIPDRRTNPLSLGLRSYLSLQNPGRTRHKSKGKEVLGGDDEAGPITPGILGRGLINRQPNAAVNAPPNVRYWGQSGHDLLHCTCLLMTQSGQPTRAVIESKFTHCKSEDQVRVS